MNLKLNSDNKIPDGFFDFPPPVERVLYEAEQPIVYLTRTKQGQQMLAYLSDEKDMHQFIIVSPATETSITRLESGSIGVREALTDSWMWMLSVNFQCLEQSVVHSITEDSVSALNLPRPGTPLLPEQRIAFSVRAVGNGIELGSVPCSVVAFVANAAKYSLKAMLDNVLPVNGEGRPTDAQRALYDLPVQRLRFSSFEIGLSEQKEVMFANDDLSTAVASLQTGLDWAEKTNSTEDLCTEDMVKKEAILRATLALTPPSQGPITSVEVGGFLLKEKKYILTRKSRTKVNNHLRLLKEEKIVFLSGRIGEIDDDKLSITLRDVDSSTQDQKASFPEELLEDMRTYYFENNRIEIAGVSRLGKLRVTAVVPLLDVQE